MNEEKRLEQVLKAQGFALGGEHAKGFCSRIYRVYDKHGAQLALKLERDDSPRQDAVKREVENLKSANKEEVGPKLHGFDEQARAVWMEYVDGFPFRDWLFSNPSEQDVAAVVNSLLLQAAKLDRIGLDHGQLAGAGTNILVEGTTPVILDFEKASTKRKVHNVQVLNGFLFTNPHSAVAKKIRAVLGRDKNG